MAAVTTTWASTKHQAIDAFNGELPNAQTEQAILDAFQAEPVAVLRELDSVAASVRAGKARSGWAVWRSRCEQALVSSDVSVDIDDRPRQIRLAEAWIRSVGGYLPSLDELLDELFGDRGRLRSWPELRDRMGALWLEVRPRFVAEEASSVLRQAGQAETLRGLRASSRPRVACTVCGGLTRSNTGICAKHRSLLEEDFRYALPEPDLVYVDSIYDPEGDQ